MTKKKNAHFKIFNIWYEYLFTKLFSDFVLIQFKAQINSGYDINLKKKPIFINNTYYNYNRL